MDKVLMPVCLWNRSRSVTGLSQGSKQPSVHRQVPGTEELKQGLTTSCFPSKLSQSSTVSILGMKISPGLVWLACLLVCNTFLPIRCPVSLWARTSSLVLRQGVPRVHFPLHEEPPCSPFFEPGFHNKGPASEDSEQIPPFSLFPVTHRPFVRSPLHHLFPCLKSTWLLPCLPWPSPPRIPAQASSVCGSRASFKPRLGHPHMPWAFS